MAKIENVKWLSGFIHGLGEFAIKQGRRTLGGLINADGEIVLEPQPKLLHIHDEKHVMLFRSERIKGDKDIVLNIETRESYSVERYFAEKYGCAITYQFGKGYGAVDADGNIVIPHKYRRLIHCGGSLYAARDRRNRCGIVDSEADKIADLVYDDISHLPWGWGSPCERFSVKQGAKWFVIDRKGRQLTQRRGSLSSDYFLGPVTPRGYAIFSEVQHRNVLNGVLDVTRDEVVIPAGYAGLRWLDGYSGGWTRIVAQKNDFGVMREEVLTLDGEYALPQVYGEIKDYFGGNYIVKSCAGGIYPDESFYGVVDESGNTIIPFEFDNIWSYYHNSYNVCRYDTDNLQLGLYSLTGETILPCEYDNLIVGDTLDYIAVCKNGEWYYVNRYGKRVLL